jgi:hypothetical protein
MQPRHRNIAGAVVVALALVVNMRTAHAADAIKLNVKAGLWEIASDGKITGAPPIPEDQLARLTPEQRARFEAAMQASMDNAAKSRVMKNCVTPEKIARGLDIGQHNPASCQKQVLTNTSSEMEVSEQCSDDKGKTNIRERFVLNGSGQLTGTVQVSKTSGEQTMTIDTTIHGKWLSASCGDVKDMEVER